MKYAEYGLMQNETVIFLHGGGLAPWNYCDKAEQLQDRFHINLHSFRFAQSQIAMKVAELLFYFPLFCYTPYSRYTTEHGGGSRIDSSILE